MAGGQESWEPGPEIHFDFCLHFVTFAVRTTFRTNMQEKKKEGKAVPIPRAAFWRRTLSTGAWLQELGSTDTGTHVRGSRALYMIDQPSTQQISLPKTQENPRGFHVKKKKKKKGSEAGFLRM